MKFGLKRILMADKQDTPKGRVVQQAPRQKGEEPPDDTDKDNIIIRSLPPWKNGS
jgi:hypothetical protein